MRVLFLSQRVPYPPNRGDKILTWRVIERLQRKHEVTVVAFAHDQADLDGAAELEKKGYPTIAIPHHPRVARAKSLPMLLGARPLTLGVYGSGRLQREVDRRMTGVDLIYGFSSSMGAFMLPHGDHPRVMHFAELDSDKWRQYAEREPFPQRWVYQREAKTLLEFEKRVAMACEENILCTPLELKIFQQQIPGAPATVIENGVDLERFRPTEVLAEGADLVFTGVMNYLPNVDACTFFVAEVLPKIRERVPGATFTIVGAHPTNELKPLASTPGVTVTGFVDDTRTFMAKAAVAVAPLRIARGIQNKVLEAMAMGLPVVASTSATQGIAGTTGRDFLVADAPEAIADLVCALLGDAGRRASLGAAARRYVEAHHDWEKNFALVDTVVERACHTHRSGRSHAS